MLIRPSTGRGFVRALERTIGLALLIGGLGVTAQAQQQQQQQEGVLEEVTVTGTRIRRDDFSAPTPTTVVDSNFMQSIGVVNVAEMIVQMPANVSNFQPTNTGGSAFFVGSTLANLRGLNPFFGTRTLTLVDSKRHVPTNQGGSVDLSAVPSILLDRMEVVTGGASAAYGSEAVSGVVNILLDKTLDGVKLDVDFGGTSEGDGDNNHFGAAWGTGLGERGHIVIGAERQTQDAIWSCSDARAWCAESIQTFANGGSAFTPVGAPITPVIPGQPSYIVSANRRANQVSRNGVIYNAGTGSQGVQISADGTGVIPFQIGQYGRIGVMQSEVGGDGRSVWSGSTLQPETERTTAMVSLNYDFSDTLTGFIDVSYGNVIGINRQEGALGFSNDGVNLCINTAPQNANPFLSGNAFLVGRPAVQAALQAANGNGGFFNCFNPFVPTQTLLRKDFTDESEQIVRTDSDSTRVVLGLSGKLGDSSWTWDTYFQQGKTEREQIGEDYRTNQRWLMAVDSIIDPRPGLATTGQPVCRVTVTGVPPSPFVHPSLMQGCVPLNPFGYQSMSAAARDYAFDPIVEFNHIEQQVLSGSLSGEVWKGWGAGPLLGAFGVEYRKEELLNTVAALPDPIRVDILLQYGDDFGGNTKVSEAFGELEMPLLADKPGAKLLSINAAYRRAHYDTTDDVGSGGSATRDLDMRKISIVWDTTDFLRIRASTSRDARAPGFRELFWSLTQPGGTDFFGQVQNPWLGPPSPFNNFGFDPATSHLTGNVNLRPEKADTTTIGFVVTPGGATSRLRFSADYYKIELVDGIQGGFGPGILTRCANAAIPEACALIQGLNPVGPIAPGGAPGFLDVTFLDVPYENGRKYEATGIDTSVDYSIPLDNGTIALRLLSTHAIKTVVRSPPLFPGGADVVRDLAGSVGSDSGFFSDWTGSPDWVHNLVFTYARGPFAITAQGRYFEGAIIDKNTPKTDPTQPGYNPLANGSITLNTTSSHFTLNLNGSYAFRWGQGDEQNAELFANLDNVTDKDPQFASGGAGFGVASTNPIYFPTLGRTYRIGARLRF
jgi:iron complex outermembrane recepter protein